MADWPLSRARTVLTIIGTLVATGAGQGLGASLAPDALGLQVAAGLVGGSAAGAVALGVGAGRHAAAVVPLGAPRWGPAIGWLAAGVAMDLVFRAVRAPDPTWREAFDTAPTATLAVALVGASVFEEVFFRGFLQTALGGTTRAALLVPAVLFALAHGESEALGAAEVLLSGLLLGAARAHTGSVWGSIGPHVAGNLLVLQQLAAG